MTDLKISKVLVMLSRIFLSSVFLFAGLLKLYDSLPFADNIAAYKLLPNALINPLAIWLPAFEVVCGLCLLLGVFKRPVLLSLSTMLLVFSVALGSALIRGLSLNCGCFSGLRVAESNPWIALVRDLILFLLAIWLLRHESRQARVPQVEYRST